jgi:hemolysin D
MSGRRAPRDFLPGDLELEERLPSPAGRVAALAIGLVLAVGLAWAWLGRVDTVVAARGKVVPVGRAQVVQPLEAGLVRAIHVRDGQPVRRGQLLIELDATASAADLQRLAQDEMAARLHVGRLTALLEEVPFGPGADAPPDLVALHARMLDHQRAEHRARLDAATLAIEQRRAALAAGLADLARREAVAVAQAERAAAYRTLLERELIARLQYLEAEAQRVSAAEEHAAQRERIVQDEAALAESQQQRDALVSDFRRGRLAELVEWEARRAALGQERAKAAQRTATQRLRAPVDGTVQQLAIHTVGGVVTPAQPLLVIVPADAPLEVEAWLPSKDVGFARAGQPVEVKVDAFPFTRYGAVAGELLAISADAVPIEGAGLAYALRIGLRRTTLATEAGTAALAPGMAVSAEILTGQRRLVEVLLSPLLRVTRESLRER